MEKLRCKRCDEVLLNTFFNCNGCKAVWCNDCNTYRKVYGMIAGGKILLCKFCCGDDYTRYECVQCPPGMCASKKCFLVHQGCSIDYVSYTGYCCMARGSDRRPYRCRGCRRWEKRKTCAIMIGIRKFRRGSLLNLLPRDVLIYCILKKFVKP